MAAPETLDQLKDWFKSYTLSQKLGLLASAASVVILLWTLVYFVNQVDFQVLYSDMEPSDAQAVVQRLQGLSVEYELSADSRTISVPAKRISEIRIQLASEGLPDSGLIGFEIFDRTNFGLTNFQEQVNFQRALEGELARSVGTLAEVNAARVHLVMPKDSLFQTPENQTKASVVLTLKRGRKLSSAAVSGLVHLVASSVKGLEPSRVTVIDYAGRILSTHDSDNPVSGRQMDTRITVETELSEKILRILEPVVGPGKVRPQVSVVMDWRQVEETIEQYDPNASVIRSEQRSSERAPGGSSAPAAGIPGPNGGPVVDPEAPPVPTSDFVIQNEVVNYEVSKSIRTIVDPVGEIERMSVAVVIDNRISVTVDEDGVASTVSVPRTPGEMTQYRDLVSATVGLDPARGDTLTVENVSFGTDEVLPVEPPTMLELQAPLILTALRYLIVPVVFLFVYLLFLRPLQKTLFANWSPSGQPQLAEAGFSPEAGLQAPMSIQQLEAQLGNSAQLPDLPSQPAAAVPAGAPGTPEREFLPLPSSNKVDLIRQRVVEHAKREPETVARLIRVWLNDEQSR